MSQDPEATVAIVDDDDDLRDALVELIQAAGWKAESYASAEAFLEELSRRLSERDTRPAGCALVDVRLPGMDGMALFRSLGDLMPGFPVIILTGHGDVPMAVEALKAGAVDFMEKPFDPDRLLDSVRQALSLDAEARQTQAMVDQFRTLLDKLTPREREVMDCMVLGNSNKGIAAKLGISPRTVEIYRARVMEKMEVKTLAELIRLSLRAMDSGA